MAGQQTPNPNYTAPVQVNTTTKEKPVKFTVPRLCGPLGTCVGGKTYQATAGKTKSTSGFTNIVSTWNMTQTSCTNASSKYTVTGTMEVALAWFSPLSVEMTWFVEGFLGVQLDFSLAASINDLTASAPGTWTITTTNGVTGTITAMNFAGCAVNAGSVDVEINDVAAPTASSKVEAKVDGSGSDVCNNLNKNVVPKLVGRTITL